MASSSPAVRNRGGPTAKKASPASPVAHNADMNGLVTKKELPVIGSEWDYKIALGVITALAFVTRFWGIGHPNEVVFDEVHFGKVRSPATAPIWNPTGRGGKRLFYTSLEPS